MENLPISWLAIVFDRGPRVKSAIVTHEVVDEGRALISRTSLHHLECHFLASATRKACYSCAIDDTAREGHAKPSGGEESCNMAFAGRPHCLFSGIPSRSSRSQQLFQLDALRRTIKTRAGEAPPATKYRLSQDKQMLHPCRLKASLC